MWQGQQIDCLSGQLKLLGVTLDALSFDGQNINICKASFFHLHALRHTQPSLTEEMENCAACSLIKYGIDYANSLHIGMSSANFDNLQRLQNTLAPVVMLSKQFDHISPILKRLHWFLIRQRVYYKVSLLTYKIRQSGEPEHIRTPLSDYVTTRNLRSAESNTTH